MNAQTSDPVETPLEAIWAKHAAEWREPAQIVSHWRAADRVDPALLQSKADGKWWDVLAEKGITLLVSREYEHLVMAMYADENGPALSYMPLPHPSGLTADRSKGTLYVASTRNPNQVYELVPATGIMRRFDRKSETAEGRPLLPRSSLFYPGCLYIHDLALISDTLYANAVGQNAVIRLNSNGSYEQVWWPKCIETEAGPAFDRNYLQLNSIASGRSIETSFFTASTDRMSARRPGHRNFPVDGRGVLFSGATGEPVVRGLTRPHSARVNDGSIWLDNSGYGEIGIVDGERFVSIARLQGWTRGLCFCGRIAFVGISRVIPQYRQYAPGLDLNQCVCGLRAIDTTTGEDLGGLTWPFGNQVFSIDWVPRSVSRGFPSSTNGRRARLREESLFYSFKTRFPSATLP